MPQHTPVEALERPIEEAPTDGTLILGYLEEFETWDVMMGRWVDYNGMEILEWVDQWNNEVYERGNIPGPLHPTKWVPLPGDSPCTHP